MRCASLLAVLAACGPPPHDAAGGAVDADPSCGTQTEEIAIAPLGAPPDLLIVLDRSSSMIAPLSGATRWTVMRDALVKLAIRYEDDLRFGLLEFPTNDNCDVDLEAAVRVPVALNQAEDLAAYFAGRAPNGNTPAQLGLVAALAHLRSLPVNPAGQFVLLATDGEPNCSAGDPAAETIAAVTALAEAGIDTFVLGFGDDLSDDSILDDAAIAGLVPRPDPPYYYAADSAEALEAALAEIAGGLAAPSCRYALAETPPVPDDVQVTLDGVPVPRSPSHVDGWDYYPDAGTITLFGAACDRITGGTVAELRFVYGCPGPVIP